MNIYLKNILKQIETHLSYEPDYESDEDFSMYEIEINQAYLDMFEHELKQIISEKYSDWLVTWDNNYLLMSPPGEF